MYEEVRAWLERELKAHGRDGSVHIEQARRDNGWLYVPVFVGGQADAYDKASVLQEIEDSWNDRESKHEFQLLLVPSTD